MIALEDLKGMTEAEIKPSKDDEASLAADLQGYNFIIAYERVGSWGCDSSSFFLMEKDGRLYENHASHCSCYGFEGQWSPEETTKEALERRSYWSLGGYDSDPEGNVASIRNAVAALSSQGTQS